MNQDIFSLFLKLLDDMQAVTGEGTYFQGRQDDDIVDVSFARGYKGGAKLYIKNRSCEVLRNVKIAILNYSNIVGLDDGSGNIGNIPQYSAMSIDVFLLDQGSRQSVLEVAWEEEDHNRHSVQKSLCTD